ncbi:MAG: TSUP family transporter [Armatimonadetes bacterium]|nr:TSUP family transporter [Armatimonadota bacterium]
MWIALMYLLVGLVAGTLGGLFGIGGGIIIIPVLVMLFHFTQQEAQGTSLAILVLPIGILAAWTYYKAGFVNISVVGFVALGFLVGGLMGAKIAVILPAAIMKKTFGMFLLLVSIKMIIGK